MVSCITSEGITLPSSLIRAHGPDQNPPADFGCPYFSRSSQVVASPCWEMALPDIIPVGPSLDAWPPTPVGSHGAHTRFFPWKHRPSPSYDKVGFPTTIRTAASVRAAFRSCRHSFMFRPLTLLATLTAPTKQLLFSSSDFYIRPPHGLLPPRVPDMLTVRTGQLTVGDFHPIKPTALSAVPITLLPCRLAQLWW